jgi:predicted nucleic acid-binding protein
VGRIGGQVRYLLDTTFLIDVLRGVPAALERLDRLHQEGDEPLVTAITTTELWAGRVAGTEAAIEGVVRYLEYLHAGPSTARRAGEWRADARQAGKTLATPDALIAATAFDAGAAVLTRNTRDFALTPVRVETY